MATKAQIASLVVSLDVDSAKVLVGLKKVQAPVKSWGEKISASIGASMQSIAKVTESVGASVKRIGTESAKVGGAMAGIGVLMLKSAAEGNAAIAHQFDRLKGAWQALAADVGKMLLPALKEVADAVSRVVQWWKELDPGIKASAVKFAEISVAVLAVVAAVGQIAGFVAALAPVFSAVGAAISAGLLGPIAAVAAVAGGLYLAWSTNLFGIRDSVETVVEIITNAFATFFDWNGSSLDSLVVHWGKVGEAIADAMTGGKNSLAKKQEATEKAQEAMRQYEATQSDILQEEANLDFWSRQGNDAEAAKARNMLTMYRADLVKLEAEANKLNKLALSTAVARPKFTWGGLFTPGLAKDFSTVSGAPIGQTPTMNALASNMGGTGSSQLSIVSASNASFAIDFAGAQQQVAAVTAKNYQVTSEIVDKLKEVANRATSLPELFGRIGQEAKDQALKDMAENAGTQSITSKIHGAIGVAVSIFGQAMAEAAPKFASVMQGAMQGAQAGGIWGAIAGAVASMLTKTEAFTQVMGLVEDGIGQLIAALEPFLQPLVQVSQLANEILGTLMQAVGPLFSMIGTVFSYLNASIGPVVSRLLSVISPLFSAIGKLFGSVSGIFEHLGPVLTPLLTLIEPVFAILGAVFKAIAWVTEGLGWLMDQALVPLGDAVKWISNGIADVVLWIVGAFRDSWNWIVNALQTLLGWTGIDFKAMRMTTQKLDQSLLDLKTTVDMVTGKTYVTSHGPGLEGDPQPGPDLKAPVDKFSDSVDKFTSSITNAPTGWRENRTRFEAQAPPESLGGWLGAMGAGAGGTTINLYGDTYGMDHLDFKMQRVQRTTRLRKKGSPA